MVLSWILLASLTSKAGKTIDDKFKTTTKRVKAKTLNEKILDLLFEEIFSINDKNCSD